MGFMAEDERREGIEERLLRAWQDHRKVHAMATQDVRSASRAATEEIAAAHRAGLGPERIAEILGVGLGAVLHRLHDAERVAQDEKGASDV